MKKIVCVLAALVAIGLGILFLGDFFNGDYSTSDPVPRGASPNAPRQEAEIEEPSNDDNSDLTQDEFDQLSQEEQDKMLEEFVLDFWEKELGLLDTDTEEKNISLEIFNRPYMQTMTEREFSQLSKEGQEKAIAEVMEDCRELRKYIMDLKAEAVSSMDDGDYGNAEACYIHSLQIGRELSKDKDGLLITRLVGIACEGAGLRGLVKLYEKVGENSSLQMARQQLLEHEEELDEIRRTTRENEAKGVTDTIF